MILAVLGLLGITVIIATVLASKPRLLFVTAPAVFVMLVCGLALNTDAMSYPKPASLETARPAEAEILWTGGNTQFIYLLLTWEGSEGPRLYSFPFTPEMKKAMEKSKNKAAATHRQLKVKNPFAGGKPSSGDEPGDGTDSGTGSGTDTENGGSGRGKSNNDNQGSDMKFWAPPPNSLPEKDSP